MQNNTQYQPPGGYAPPPAAPSNPMAVGSLVCGILSVVFSFPYGSLLALVLGIVGLILGVMGMKRAKLMGVPPGMATAGLVISVIGTILAAIITAACTAPIICACGKVASEIKKFSY